MIKTIFARSLPVSKRHKDVRKRDRERGVRQQRFWEYFLLHDKTFAAYVDSCLLQSGKHRYLAYVADWPHSTFQAGAAFTLKAGSYHWNMLCLPRTSASKRVRRVTLRFRPALPLPGLRAAHFGLEPGKIKGWPKLIDMLTEVGHRIEYRTVYMAMCSQAHHDAEDVLNFFIVNSIEGQSDLGEQLERETDTFSLFMLLFGLKWFVMAAIFVGAFLGFPTVVEEGKKSFKWLDSEHHAMTSHLDSGTFPQHWATPTRKGA